MCCAARQQGQLVATVVASGDYACLYCGDTGGDVYRLPLLADTSRFWDLLEIGLGGYIVGRFRMRK